MTTYLHRLVCPTSNSNTATRQVCIRYHHPGRKTEKLERPANLRSLALVLNKGERADIRIRDNVTDGSWSRVQTVTGGTEIKRHHSVGWIHQGIVQEVSYEKAKAQLQKLREYDTEVEEFVDPPRSTESPYGKPRGQEVEGPATASWDPK